MADSDSLSWQRVAMESPPQWTGGPEKSSARWADLILFVGPRYDEGTICGWCWGFESESEALRFHSVDLGDDAPSQEEAKRRAELVARRTFQVPRAGESS